MLRNQVHKEANQGSGFNTSTTILSAVVPTATRHGDQALTALVTMRASVFFFFLLTCQRKTPVALVNAAKHTRAVKPLYNLSVRDARTLSDTCTLSDAYTSPDKCTSDLAKLQASMVDTGHQGSATGGHGLIVAMLILLTRWVGIHSVVPCLRSEQTSVRETSSSASADNTAVWTKMLITFQC